MCKEMIVIYLQILYRTLAGETAVSETRPFRICSMSSVHSTTMFSRI